MSRKKLIIIVLIIIILIVGLVFIIKNNNGKEKNTMPGSTIDVNHEAYAGKKIYVEDGDTIVEEANGSKTIETTKTLNKTDLKEATEKTKEKYEIIDVKVIKYGAQTKVTGKVKSNNSAKKDITIQAKFYTTENRVKGSASIRLNEVKSKEERDFEITIVGDLTKYECKVNVEFTN